LRGNYNFLKKQQILSLKKGGIEHPPGLGPLFVAIINDFTE
jgi:hypothetical protein